MITAALALMLMQVGPGLGATPMPGAPDEMRDRPPRTVAAPTPAPAIPRAAPALSQCLALAGASPQAALDQAQRLRDSAGDDLELAQAAHCLGLALSGLARFDEARRAFETAVAEAPEGYPGYRARLSAMAGNAALAASQPAVAEPLLAAAGNEAERSGDTALLAGIATDHARALVALERLDQAASALQEARRLAPTGAQAWLLSATLARRMDQLGEAQAHASEAARLDPRDPAIALEAGVIAALHGRDAEARTFFASVATLGPGTPEAEQAARYLAQLPQ